MEGVEKKVVKKFIIAGGGTGGHIFPAIAIANAIKDMEPDAEFLFVGAEGKMEMEKVPQAGFKIKGLTIAGFNRSSLIKNIGLPFKLIKSFFQVAGIIKSFRPDAVIGVGGYSTFPVLRYAQSKKIPTFIHEANSFAGKSNIMLGKKASMIFTATDGMEKFFPAHKIMVTGNPVRKSITEGNVTHEESIRFFGLKTNKTTVLCIGGSLGAKSINEAVNNNVELFEKNNLQLIWQTGTSYLSVARRTVIDMKNVYLNDFISRMDYAYTAADIVISRSGAMSIAELCIAGKPVVFVPFPYAAEDHQKVNAMHLVDKNAALMVEDQNALTDLISTVIELSKNHVLQKTLKENISKLGIYDADKKVAQKILEKIKR